MLKENNLKIAQFIGCNFTDLKTNKSIKNFDSEDNTRIELFFQPCIGIYYSLNSLGFHEKWNWIHPVLKKIKTDYNLDITINYDESCNFFDETTSIITYFDDKNLFSDDGDLTLQIVYKNIIKFIETL